MNYYNAPSGKGYIFDKNYAYMVLTDFYYGLSGGLIEKLICPMVNKYGQIILMREII